MNGEEGGSLERKEKVKERISKRIDEVEYIGREGKGKGS